MYGDQSRKFVFQNKFELQRPSLIIQHNLSLQTLVYCRYVMAFGGGHGGFWYLKLFFQVVFPSVIQIFMSNTGQYFKTLDLMLNNNYTISDS